MWFFSFLNFFLLGHYQVLSILSTKCFSSTRVSWLRSQLLTYSDTVDFQWDFLLPFSILFSLFFNRKMIFKKVQFRISRLKMTWPKLWNSASSTRKGSSNITMSHVHEAEMGWTAAFPPIQHWPNMTAGALRNTAKKHFIFTIISPLPLVTSHPSSAPALYNP